MFPSHLEYLKGKDIYWFSPCYAFHQFWKEISAFQKENNLDFQDAWKHRGMKRAKEIYATAIAALGMRQSEAKLRPWWIGKPDQDPPDGIIGTVNESDNANYLHVREVEVVEHINGDLLHTLETKLRGKYYEPNTILVCFVSESGVYNFETLAQQVQQKNLSLQHVFLVAQGGRLIADPKTMSQQELFTLLRKVSFVQLAPIYAFIEIDPFSTCDGRLAENQVGWLKFEKRGKGAGLRRVTTNTPPKLF